jgi:hypothetical protein
MIKKISIFKVLIWSLITFGFTFNVAAQDGFIIEFTSGLMSTIDYLDGSTTPVGTTNSQMVGIDFGPNEVLYGLNASTNGFYEIDTANATMTLLGINEPPSGHSWTGLVYDYDSGIMYAMSIEISGDQESSLYTIDLTDGDWELVGSQYTATAIACIATDLDGQMYGLDITSPCELYSIDKSDGSVELIGSAGFYGAGINYGMDFSSGNQKMYLTVYDAINFQSHFATINLTNGNTTVISICLKIHPHCR